MQSDDFIIHTASLRDLGGQRVWSLMVSLFGDLAQGEGDVIEGPVLTAIMNVLQVKPEATRVALHRLRKDGWLTSEKSGRISQHSLSMMGRAESAAASPRIYAQPDCADSDWKLVLIEKANPDAQAEMAKNGFTMLTGRIFIGHAKDPAPEGAMSFSAQTIPAWLPKQLEPARLRNDYLALFDALAVLKTVLQDPVQLEPLQIAVLRCLIVHNWRRLVLKHPSLPKALIAEDWAGLRCHRAVAELLQKYPRPSLSAISASCPTTKGTSVGFC